MFSYIVAFTLKIHICTVMKIYYKWHSVLGEPASQNIAMIPHNRNLVSPVWTYRGLIYDERDPGGQYWTCELERTGPASAGWMSYLIITSHCHIPQSLLETWFQPFAHLVAVRRASCELWGAWYQWQLSMDLLRVSLVLQCGTVWYSVVLLTTTTVSPVSTLLVNIDWNVSLFLSSAPAPSRWWSRWGKDCIKLVRSAELCWACNEDKFGSL